MLRISFFSAVFIWLFSANIYADQFDANVSIGHEKITSPIVRIEPEGASILVDGRSKLAGQYYQLGLNGLKDWDLGNQSTFNLSADMTIKKAPKADDLEYGIASMDAMYRKTFGAWSVGFGPAVQRFWLLNDRFRDSVTVQTDLTFLKIEEGFTNLYFSASKNIHVNEFDFLDSKSATASLTHHMEKIGWGFSALDLQLSATREKNARDFDDLSSHSYYVRASIDRKMLGLDWSVGASVTKSYFDAPFLEDFPKRKESYVSYEFGLVREISDHFNFGLDFIKARNFSNVVLYESDYRLVSLTLSYTH